MFCVKCHNRIDRCHCLNTPSTKELRMQLKDELKELEYNIELYKVQLDWAKESKQILQQELKKLKGKR